MLSLSMGLLVETVIPSVKFGRFSVRLKLSVMLQTFPVLSSPGGVLDLRLTQDCHEIQPHGAQTLRAGSQRGSPTFRKPLACPSLSSPNR